jgi:PAS domain S-box-containing protein
VNPFPFWLPWGLLAAALAAAAWLRHRHVMGRRRDGEKLAATETMLRRISQAVESTSDAIGIGDMAGHSLYHNRAHRALFGYTPDELNAVPESGVLFADKVVAQEILRTIRAGRSWHGETDILTKDGRRVPAFVRADLIRDEAGRPVGIYGVFADMTEERQRSAELARAGRLESLGLLAGGIAHDFNNLLAAMNAQLLLAQMDATLSPVLTLRLKQIESIVTRATGLTNGLKVFAKDGLTEKRITPLSGLIRETADLAVQGAALTLDCQLPADLLPVEVDPSQLGQVLHNIVLNAAQAMAPGGRIEITARNLAPGDDPAVREGQRWVKVAIADTGPGMAPEVMAKIFDPFFTTKARGTGLGLATSHSIIEQHGGRLRVESTVGRGTTFFILLPAVSAARIAVPDVRAA